MALACLSVLLATALATGARAGEVEHRLPQMASVFPQGAGPGSALTVEILGQHLDRSREVVFLSEGLRGAVVESRHTRLAARLEIDSEAALGPHYFRVVSPRGPSNVLLFRVGDQPHLLESEPNDRPEEAQAFVAPATLNGRLDRTDDIDTFRFAAEAGEEWIFDVRAARNGSGLDPSLILLDSAGRKLLHSEDYFIWDPFFGCTIPDSGEYTVVLQPTRSRARPTHGYQLDVRQAPFLEAVSPLAFSAGSTTEATILGVGLPASGFSLELSGDGLVAELGEVGAGRAAVRITAAANALPGKRTLAVATSEGRSNPLAIWLHDLPPHAAGGPLAVPSAVAGTARYERPERFFFQAQAGETLVFEVRAQRLGSPVDMTLRIVGPDPGTTPTEVAANDDAGFPGVRFNKDPQLVHTFERAGTYELQVRSLWRPAGSARQYFLEVRRPRPRLELLLDSDRSYAYAGEDGKVGVTVHRLEGFAAGAELALAGLPEGFAGDPVAIPPSSGSPAGQDAKPEAVLLPFRAAGPPGRFATARVVAAGSRTVAWRSVRIASGGGEGATEAQVAHVALAVAERPRFNLEAQLRTVNLVRGGSAQIPVAVRRAPDASGPLRFAVENLPKGLTFTANSFDQRTDRSTITLQAAAETAPGSYTTVAILGTDPSGATEQAPPITVVVD